MCDNKLHDKFCEFAKIVSKITEEMDIDLSIIDSYEDLHNAVMYTAKLEGVSVPSRKQQLVWYG